MPNINQIKQQNCWKCENSSWRDAHVIRLSVHYENTSFLLLPQWREPPQNLLHFKSKSTQHEITVRENQLNKKTRGKKAADIHRWLLWTHEDGRSHPLAWRHSEAWRLGSLFTVHCRKDHIWTCRWELRRATIGAGAEQHVTAVPAPSLTGLLCFGWNALATPTILCPFLLEIRLNSTKWTSGSLQSFLVEPVARRTECKF